MRTVKVYDGMMNLSKILEDVEGGEIICILREDTPVAALAPLTPEIRGLGFGNPTLLDSFFDDLPEEELEAWEGDWE